MLHEPTSTHLTTATSRQQLYLRLALILNQGGTATVMPHQKVTGERLERLERWAIVYSGVPADLLIRHGYAD